MKKIINRFSVWLKASSLFVRLLVVAVAVAVFIGVVMVTMMPTLNNKPNTVIANNKDEQKTTQQESVSTPSEEKPDEIPSSTPMQQTAPQQPTPTPAEPPKDDNSVTVEDIPKDLFGWSEYHAFKRRIEVGKPDAIKGMVAGHLFANYYCRQQSTTSPSKYAIACLLNGNRGHMAFVEDVNDDSSIRVTEMNYEGWNRVSERVIPKDQAANYRYIP